MWIHIISGILILLCTYALGLLAMEHLNWEIANLPHTIVGFIIIVLTGLVVLGGASARYALYFVRWNTQTS